MIFLFIILAILGAGLWFIWWFTRYPPIPADPSYEDEVR